MNQPLNWGAGVFLDVVYGHLHTLHRGQQPAPAGYAYVLYVPSLGYFQGPKLKPTPMLQFAKRIGHLYLAHDYGAWWRAQLSIPVAETMLVRLIEERNDIA